MFNSKNWLKQWLDSVKIGRKIAYGYTLALGIAVLGTTAGLVIGNSYQQYAYQLREDFLEELDLVIQLQNRSLHLQKHQQQFLALLDKTLIFSWRSRWIPMKKKQ